MQTWNVIRKFNRALPGISCYNFYMDKTKTLKIVCDLTNRVWDTMGEIHPRILKLDPPEIYLCGRLTRTAGKCYQEKRRIHLGWKFFQHSKQYRDIMYHVILPHEIIHQIDYDLWGESDKKCGHGKNWQMLMLQYGLEPNPYHSMDLTK